MGSIQPQNDPQIPEELTKRIEGVKNQITDGESEVKRLSDLIASKNYEIEQLHKSKVSLEAQIEDLRREKQKVVDDIKEANKSLTVAKKTN